MLYLQSWLVNLARRAPRWGRRKRSAHSAELTSGLVAWDGLGTWTNGKNILNSNLPGAEKSSLGETWKAPSHVLGYPDQCWRVWNVSGTRLERV